LRLNAPALVVQEVGEGPKNTRTVTSFFVMPYTLLVVLTSSISGDLQSLLCTDPPITIGDKQEQLVTASPVTTKSLGLNWG
jgi:hypothetical protein